MKSKFLVLLTVLAVMCWAVVAFPSGAQATGLLTLFDGTTLDTISDNGVGDSNPAVGAITFIGPVSPTSIWTINVTTGLSGKPSPGIDLNSIDSSTGAGTLILSYTDTGFTLGTSATMLIGGTAANGTVANTALFDLTPIHTFTGLGPGAFSDTFTGAISPFNPTSLTEIVTIMHRDAGVTSFDASLNTSAVPLPPSALLLGSGLLGLVGLRRFRKS